jgi:uncharacterized cupin superfamily protein
MSKGESLTVVYAYDESLIILEGSFGISDDAGNKSVARAGDIYFYSKGVQGYLVVE